MARRGPAAPCSEEPRPTAEAFGVRPFASGRTARQRRAMPAACLAIPPSYIEFIKRSCNAPILRRIERSDQCPHIKTVTRLREHRHASS
jgi:hypothetical protein